MRVAGLCVRGGGVTGDGEGDVITEVLIGEGDGSCGGSDVLCGAVAAQFSDVERVGAGIDGGEVVGAADGDGELFSALDAMAVVDLSGPSEFEGVALFQPIEISGLRIEGPVDGLCIAIGEESGVCEGDGVCRDELIDDNGG